MTWCGVVLPAIGEVRSATTACPRRSVRLPNWPGRPTGRSAVEEVNRAMAEAAAGPLRRRPGVRPRSDGLHRRQEQPGVLPVRPVRHADHHGRRGEGARLVRQRVGLLAPVARPRAPGGRTPRPCRWATRGPGVSSWSRRLGLISTAMINHRRRTGGSTSGSPAGSGVRPSCGTVRPVQAGVPAARRVVQDPRHDQPDHGGRALPGAGIIAASGGNAGLAAAYAARELGVPAEVYVPVTAPPVKVAKLAKLGARVVQVGNEYAEATRPRSCRPR